MRDHKLFILHSFAFQLEFVDVVKVRVRVFYADDAVDVILLHKDALGDLLQQIEEWEFIEVWDLVLFFGLFLFELATAFDVLLFALLVSSLVYQ